MVTATNADATVFPRIEYPITDGGRWLKGQTVGADWTAVSTPPAHAIGHQGILNGDWTPKQRATATVFTSGAVGDDCYPEVSLRLRSSIVRHNSRGYEASFRSRRRRRRTSSSCGARPWLATSHISCG